MKESIGLFSKISKPFIIITIVFITISILAQVYTAIGHSKETGNFKPIIESLGGNFISADYNIKQSLLELQKPDLSEEYSSYLREKIIKNLIKILILFTILFIAVKWLFSIFGETKDSKTNWMASGSFYFVVGLTAITIALAFQWAYVAIMYKTNFIPFSGVYELIKTTGINTLIENFGSYTINTPILNQINQTVL